MPTHPRSELHPQKSLLLKLKTQSTTDIRDTQDITTIVVDELAFTFFGVRIG